MSKDIRSFFAPKEKKQTLHQATVSQKKKKKIVIDSDSDEPQELTPKKKKTSKSDSCDKKLEKLKPINVADLFGNDKVKQSVPNTSFAQNELKSGVKHSSKELEEIHSDEDFEATLCQIDEIEKIAILGCNIGQNHISTEHEGGNNSNNIGKHVSEVVKSTREEKNVFSPSKNYSKEKKGKNEKLSLKLEKNETPAKSLDLNESLKSPADPLEKKRQQTQSYMRYLNRGGPKHLGSKELPKGKAGCLSGLVFVVSGVLDSLERETAVQLIEQYGGKVTSSVSRNTSFLIRGEEAGETKLKKAESLKVPIIDEDGLFGVIKTRSEEMTVKKYDSLESRSKRKKSVETNAEENLKQSKKVKIQNASKEISENNRTEQLNKLEINKSDRSPQRKRLKTDNSTENKSNIETKTHCSVSKLEKEINVPLDSSDLKSSLWVDKYKPTKTKQIIGQQGDRSCLKKLIIWLENWHKSHSSKKKHIKPSPWAKQDDGAYFKAALISGPPGIGKTTMAHLVSKELGFDVVEFNASDTRSKKLLNMEISGLLSNKTLFGYVHSCGEVQQPSIKHVLLMDEVDGMAGNEDRGGVQELIQLIKHTRVPVICMCNDRNHPKIRSLANYCFDLRVMKPRLEQIRGAMMSVCYKEGLKITPDALNDIICGANFDIRQVLHHLSLWSAKEKQSSDDKQYSGATTLKKDMKMGPWDVVKKVFSIEDHKHMSIYDKSDLFFHDYGINPLFVQENYLSVSPVAAKGNVPKILQCIAVAADSISIGDVVEKCIRSKGSWSLLPVQAMFSSVIPGDAMEGYIKGQINFPTWLGKNSRTGKLDRLLQELHVHTRLSTSGSKQALNMEYLPFIRDAIIRPLATDGSSGVLETLNVMKKYNLLREDLDSILELTVWPSQSDPMNAVESKVKAALTRAYNKEGFMTPYSVVNVIKKRSNNVSEDYEGIEIGDEEESEENDDASVDAMIKTKKPQKIATETQPRASRGKGKMTSESRGKQKNGRVRGK